MAARPDLRKRRFPALLLAAVGAGLPACLRAADPGPPLAPFMANAWVGFEYPLINLFLCLAIAALLVVALLRRRHRPELLAVCLALSLVLHLLSLSLFSLIALPEAPAEPAPTNAAGRIRVGKAILRESQVSQAIRVEPLVTDLADAQDRLAPDRAAQDAPVKVDLSRAQADLREAGARDAGRVDVKTPGVTPPKKNVDQALDAAPIPPLEIASVKIAMSAEVQREPDAEPAAPAERVKQFDVGPIPQAPLPRQAAQPEAPPVQREDALRPPARAPVDFAGVEMRQPEVKEAIQPAAAGGHIDQLEFRARETAGARGPEKIERAAPAGPSADVRLDKRSAAPPPPGEQRPASAEPADQPRMEAQSLAAGPGAIERKKSAPDEPVQEAAAAPVIEPVRIRDVRPLVASLRPDAPGQLAEAVPAGQRELTVSKDKGAVPGADAVIGKPSAGVNHAAPRMEPIRIGLGGDVAAAAPSKSPAVQEVISGVSAERPGRASLENPSPQMEIVSDDRRAAGPVADELAPSDLGTVRISGGLGTDRVAARPVAPKLAGGIQNAGERTVTLVGGAGTPLSSRGSAPVAVNDPLAGAQANGGNLAGLGLVDVGAPARTVAGASLGASPSAGMEMRPVALAPARAGPGAVAGESGELARPAPAGRSDPAVSHASFVGPGGGGVAPRAEVVTSTGAGRLAGGTTLPLAGGALKITAGRIGMEQQQREVLPPAAEYGRGQPGLAPGKAEREAVDSGIAARRFQAPVATAGGPSVAPEETTMVQPNLGATMRAPAAGPAGAEPLAGWSASARATDLSLPAPAVMRPDSASGRAADAGRRPAGGAALQVAKAVSAEDFLFEPQGGGGMGEPAGTGGVQEREHARMQLGLDAAPTKARVTSDIYTSPVKERRRSFLAAGKAPVPDFVPEKAIYRMRKPEKRRQFISELGGTAETEEAVEQALVWLSRAQSDGGRWDVDGFKTLPECGGAGDLTNEDVGLTGLVLLAYLGAGYTHLDGAYQETVRKGLDWLLNVAKENGDIRGDGQMYGQAMATAALCESYSLTGDERLLAPTRQAVKFILDSQTPGSGWRYMSQNDSDTSVTGWQILALKSAQIAGFEVPDKAFKWMAQWLDKVRQGADGGLYSYKPGHVVTPVMTAEGAFCQLFMDGQARARAQAESTAFLMQNLPVWNPERRTVHIYYWYYATLTMYLSGAPEFAEWNAALTKALLQGRNKSGPAAGSWDPVCLLGFRGGRVYSTAVGALCLEVYYRFMPLYKQKSP